MSLTNLLQERLAEEPLVGDQISLSAGLNDDERLVVHLRSLEAKKKNLETEIEETKAEIRERAQEGERVGSDEVGHYQIQVGNRESFNYNQAMKDGLFNTEQAKPYLKTTEIKSLVFKGPEKKK